MSAPVFALAVRLVSALRSGALLVARRTGVAHVYSGPVTASGLYARSGYRALCGARTQRLTVLMAGVGALGEGRRLCRRCAPRIPDVPDGSPYAGRLLVSLDDKAMAFAHMTVDDFLVAAQWCQTVEDTHQVGYLAQLVLGPAPMVPRTEVEHRRKRVDTVLNDRRRRLTNAALSDDERAARAMAREAEADERQRINAARARQARIDRATDRRNSGSYLMPWERTALDGAAT